MKVGLLKLRAFVLLLAVFTGTLLFASSPRYITNRVESEENVDCAPKLSDYLQSFEVGPFTTCHIDDARQMVLVRAYYPKSAAKFTERFQLVEGCSLYWGEDLMISGRTAHKYMTPVYLRLVMPDGSELPFMVALTYGDLPVLYIETLDQEKVDSREEYREITNATLVNSACDTIFSKARIKGRGNSSWYFSKKSYTLKLDKKAPLLGLKKHKTYALVANHSDKTLLRNALAYDLGRELFDNMAWNPSTRPVNLVLNGNFMGLYSLTETNKIDQNRIDIPNIEDCPSTDQVSEYGFLLEINKYQDESFNFITSHDVAISLKEPDGADIPEEYRDYILDMVVEFEGALFGKGYRDETSENYYGRFFDVNSLIDWYLVNEIAKNHDAQGHSSIFFYFDPADQKFHMGPLWDFDLAFGNINYGNCDLPEYFHVRYGTWISRIFNDKAFSNQVKARYVECRDRMQQYVYHWIQDQADCLAADVEANFARWAILGEYVWPNPDGYGERTTYQSEVDYLRDWLDRRLDWLDLKYGVQVKSVTIDMDQLRLVEGTTAELTATISPASATLREVLWTSSDPAVVTVDEGGRVTAVSKGEARITATCGVRQAVCDVHVGKTTVIEDAGIDMSDEYYTLSGIRVDGSRLTPGFYIKKTGHTATKIQVKW